MSSARHGSRAGSTSGSARGSAATSGRNSAATGASGRTSTKESVSAASGKRSTSIGRTGSIVSQQSMASPPSQVKRSSVGSIPSPLQDADQKASRKSSARNSSVTRRPSGPDSLYTPTPASEELRASMLMDQVRSSLDRGSRTSGTTGGSAVKRSSARASASGTVPGGSFAAALQDTRNSMATQDGRGSLGTASVGSISGGAGSLPGFGSQSGASGLPMGSMQSASEGASFSAGDANRFSTTVQSTYSASQRTSGSTVPGSFGNAALRESQPTSILRTSTVPGMPTGSISGSQGVSFQQSGEQGLSRGSVPFGGLGSSFASGTGGSVSIHPGSFATGSVNNSFAMQSGGSGPASYATQQFGDHQQSSFARGSVPSGGYAGSFAAPPGVGSIISPGSTSGGSGGSFAVASGGSVSRPSSGDIQQPFGSFGERQSMPSDFRGSVGSAARGSFQQAPEGMRTSAAGSGMLPVPGSFSQPGGSFSVPTGGSIAGSRQSYTMPLSGSISSGAGRTSTAPSITARQSTVTRTSTVSRPTTLRFSASTTSQPGQRRSTTASSARKSTSSSRRSRVQDEEAEAVVEDISEATDTEVDAQGMSGAQDQVRPTLTGLQLTEDALIDDPWVQGEPQGTIAKPSLRGSRGSLGTSSAAPSAGRPSATGASIAASMSPSDAQRPSTASASSAGPSSVDGSRPSIASQPRASSLNEDQRASMAANESCPMPESHPPDERGSATGRAINMTHRAFCRPGLSPCAIVKIKKTSAKKSSVPTGMPGSLPRDSLALKRTTTLRHTKIVSGAETIETVEEEEELEEDSRPEYVPEKIYRGVMVYAFGGYDGISFNQQICRQVLRYDLQTETWDVVGEMPCVRVYPAVVTYGDHIYIIGGANADCSSSMMSPARGPSNQMFRYTPSSNSWMECPPMIYKRMHLTAAAAFGMIMVFGGQDEYEDILNSVEIFDIDSNTWRTGSSMRIPLYGASAALIGSVVHVTGGITCPDIVDGKYNVVTRVHAYDPYTNEWAVQHAMPIRRAFHGGIGVDGQTHTMAGASPGTNYVMTRSDPPHFLAHKDIFAYCAPIDKWKKMAYLKTARFSFGTAAIGSTIIVAGGYGEKIDEVLDSTEHYDIYTQTVRPGGRLPVQRVAFQMVAFHFYEIVPNHTCPIVCPTVCFDPELGTCLQRTADGYVPT